MIDPKVFFLSNNKGEKSATLTAFAYGFLVVNLKLLFSGMVVGPVHLSDFTGVDFAASLSALGAIYVLNKNVTKDKKPSTESESK